MTDLHRRIFDAVVTERGRQDEKWGVQRYPFRPTGEDWDNSFKVSMILAQDLCDHQAKEKKLTWWHILDEEFQEALSASRPEHRILEIIQFLAVGVAALEQLLEESDARRPVNRQPMNEGRQIENVVRREEVKA